MSIQVITIPEIGVNGVNLFYEIRGEGKPMYVLHGGPGLDHRYFGRSLAKLEGIRELYYIDFRGHGKSSKTDKNTYTLDTFADDIEAFRKKMGHETIEIFGHSMGGFVGLLYTLQYEQHLNTLILVGTVAKISGITGHYAVKIKLIFLNLKYYLDYRINNTISKDAFAREILLMSWPIYVPKRMHKEFSDYIESLDGLEIFFDMQNELLEFDVNEELDNIKVPTLVIFGEKDAFLKDGRPLKTIKDSRFSVMPSVKHLPFLEDEKHFNMIVMDFLTHKIL